MIKSRLVTRNGNVGVATIAGIAVLLVLVGTTISAFSRMEAELSKRYLDQLRARVLAQNGLAFAVDQLKAIHTQELMLDKERSWQYYGEDIDADGQLDKNEDQNSNGFLDTAACPLKDGLRPSFPSFRMIQAGNNKSPRIKNIGYSNESFATYHKGNDVYSLKVIDCNSQIYINATDNGTRQTLNNLGVILGIEKLRGEKGDKKALGDAIYELRLKQPKGFTVKEELQQILEPETYGRIKDYVTLYARVDSKVIKPRPHSARRAPLKAGQDVYAWSELNPGPVALEPRAPININAAGKPVLMSALANLEAVYLDEADEAAAKLVQSIDGGAEKPANKTDKIRIGRLAGVSLKWTDQRKMIEAVADRIIKRRAIRPFLEWADFNEFCDGLVAEEIFGKTDTAADMGAAQARADLIKAQANPNTGFNKFNPDRPIYRMVDKSDLATYTTEFCFAPGGCFEIESLGMVFKPAEPQSNKLNPPPAQGGAEGAVSISGLSVVQILEAEYLLRSVVDVFAIYTETAQKDFLSGAISKAGNEANTANNKTLMTYPEPVAVSGGCPGDGLVGLSTVEVSHYADDKVTFRHHFRNLNADYAKGSNEMIKTDGKPAMQSVLEGGSIYPDGIYSEWGRCPAYAAEGNLVDGPAHEKLYGAKRFRGTLSLWLKPNYRQHSAKPRIIFSATKAADKEPHKDYRYQSCQNVFELFAFPFRSPNLPGWAGRMNIMPAGNLVWFWEIDESRGNQPDEYIFTHPIDKSMGDVFQNDPHHKWMHIGIAWDTHPGKPRRETLSCRRCNGTGRIDWYTPDDNIGDKIAGPCRDCKGTGEIVRSYNKNDTYTFCVNGRDLSEYAYGQATVFPPDIIQLMPLSVDNLIRFGERSDAPFWNSSGDFTVDEATIQLHQNVDEAKEYIIGEYKKGRYYKGSGSFVSAEVNLGQASNAGQRSTVARKLPAGRPKYKIMSSWTVYYPAKWDKGRRPVKVEFLNADQEPVSDVLANPQGGEFETTEPSVRYRVKFHGDTEDLNTPLTETPFFDDINIMVFKPAPVVVEQYIMP